VHAAVTFVLYDPEEQLASLANADVKVGIAQVFSLVKIAACCVVTYIEDDAWDRMLPINADVKLGCALW
jgi:hypothetical protein